MKFKNMFSINNYLLLLITILLNSIHTYSQVDNDFEIEKLTEIFYYLPEEKVSEFIKISNQLQIQFKEENGEIIVFKNNKKCILTTDIIDYVVVENKADIIERTVNSIAKWKSYYNLQSKIAVSLSKHIKAYKSNLMNKTRRVTWQKETKECMSIQEKMNKIPFTDSSIFYKQLSSEENQVHSSILDILNASRDILGI